MVVGVCYVKLPVGDAEAAGFVETGVRAVLLARFAVAEKRLDGARRWVEQFDFVVVSVGNKDFAIVPRDAERVLQTHFVAFAVLVAKVEEVAASQSLYRAGLIQTDGANDVRFTICHVKSFSVSGYAGRLGKGGGP